jgi:hypothetical protein
MINVWNGNFSCWEDVVKEFCGCSYDEDKFKLALKAINKPTEVIYANYDIDGYEGSAFVLWRKGRKYYILEGSHCSCYGLEESGWNPEEFKSKKEFLEYLNKVKYIFGVPKEVFDELKTMFGG